MTTLSKIGDARARLWRKGLILKKDDEPKKLVANVLHVLTSHPAWEGVLVFDEFTFTTSKRKPAPTRPQDGESALGEWTEADTARTRAWFASEVGFEPGAADVEQAVEAVARKNGEHPVRAYLTSLAWDGTPRLDSFLTTYFGATSTPYTLCIGPRWLISAVARVMRPGCQVDCMLVLEGKQGAGKSTGLAALFSPERFADTGIHIGDKDSYQALRGKWCYEFGELAAIKGRDVERVKSFVSARVDTYRPSYARRTVDFERQCVFAGTTNDGEYLTDRTGNRRFWPVACGTVDVLRLRADRDQLWAEARVRFAAGEAWHVDSPELRALCEQEQAAREVDDPWQPIVSRWLKSEAVVLGGRAEKGITTEEALSEALKHREHEMNHGAHIRVGSVLRKIGWEPTQVRRDGVRVRLYRPASQSSQAVTG